jgi:hypothetical protein
MSKTLAIGAVAAIGGPIAAIVLLASSPAARADELADLRASQEHLRANQEFLQKRIDQLSQAPPPGAPGPYVPGFGPETRPAAAPVTTGSFPRSFLIPGTDTSLRIGGFAKGTALWYLKGAAVGGALNSQGGNVNQTFTEGPGGTGNLANIPLNNTISHSRSSSFDISGKQSRVLFDARTPTAWGEAKAYIEIDFAIANTNTVNNGTTGVASGWITRFRKGYATLGGLLAGQETGVLHDPDADPELVSFAGMASAAGRAREPQVKYTYRGPYGTVWTAGIENPVPRMNGPFGRADLDSNAIPGIAACSVTGNTAANLPATTACLGNAAFFDPLKSAYPELIGTARINQPWGHIQIGAVVRTDQLNDGQYLDRTYVGYGGTISGDVHPFSGTPGPWGKDDLGFGFGSGNEIGGQLANGAGLVTNFGRSLFVPGFGFVDPRTNGQWNTTNSATRRAYDRVVRSQSPNSTDGWIWYQHWWTDNLRSTILASGIYNSLNTNLLGQNTTNNKQLSQTHVNLFWSPVAFVDFGVEYGWGHRVTVANFKGDSYTLQGAMTVRFYAFSQTELRKSGPFGAV